MENFADIGVTRLLLVWAVVVFASVLRSFTGFGFALAAVPVFSVFLPPTEVVVLTALLTCSIGLMSLPSFWGVVPLRPLVPLLVMAVPGTAAGTMLLSLVSAAQFQLGVGLSVILACAGLGFFRMSTQRRVPLLGGVAGLLSGLMNGAMAIPGPPLIVHALLTESQPRRSRAMLMMLFLVSALLALAFYAASGFVDLRSTAYFVLAFPALYAGHRLGNRLFHRFGETLYRRVALAALLAVGVSTVLRALA
jgi:uncharacterized membrane protein YfcA